VDFGATREVTETGPRIRSGDGYGLRWRLSKRVRNDQINRLQVVPRHGIRGGHERDTEVPFPFQHIARVIQRNSRNFPEERVRKIDQSLQGSVRSLIEDGDQHIKGKVRPDLPFSLHI